MVIVDDALLLAVLAGAAPDEIAVAHETGDLFTTASWYYRLARAAHDYRFTGALSSALAALPPQRQAGVLAAIDDLPGEIGMADMRLLVPVMTRLDVGRRLNFLTAEAVALAVTLNGAICVTTTSALIADACRAMAIDLRLVAV